jgi:peptide/nickel transport system permease protein
MLMETFTGTGRHARVSAAGIRAGHFARGDQKVTIELQASSFAAEPRRRRRPLAFLATVRRAPLPAAALAFIVVLVIAAVFAPWLAPFDPDELHRIDRLQSPGSPYWLGTDSTGRDQLSRIIWGSRVSLYVGVAPILVSCVVGTVLGAVSGYCGGPIDLVLQRVAEAVSAIPPLLIAIAVVALMGPRLTNVVFAIAIVTAPAVNRVARAATMQTTPLPYVLAARSIGASHARVIVRHILPNIAAPVIIVGASLVGTAILAEAGLSFLGLGVRPPAATWGNMIGGDNRIVFEIAPWLVIFPGLAITLTVLAFNLVGDGLRDLLDPRAKRVRGPK